MSESMDTETGEMIVKRVSVPIGLEELMEGLTKEVLLKKPDDIYLFAAEYFSKLLSLRDKGNYKVKSVTSVQSISRQSPKQLSEKLLIRGASKQLSRQISIRGEPPVKRNVPPRKPLPRKDQKDDKTAERSKFIERRTKMRKAEAAELKKAESKPIVTPRKVLENAEDKSTTAKRRERSVSTTRRGRPLTTSSQSTPRQKSTSTPRKHHNDAEDGKGNKNLNKGDDKHKKAKVEDEVQEKPSVPKVSSVEESQEFIKDGRLTVTPPKVIKRPQTPPDSELISSLAVPLTVGNIVSSSNSTATDSIKGESDDSVHVSAALQQKSRENDNDVKNDFDKSKDAEVSQQTVKTAEEASELQADDNQNINDKESKPAFAGEKASGSEVVKDIASPDVKPDKQTSEDLMQIKTPSAEIQETPAAESHDDTDNDQSNKIHIDDTAEKMKENVIDNSSSEGHKAELSKTETKPLSKSLEDKGSTDDSFLDKKEPLGATAGTGDIREDEVKSSNTIHKEETTVGSHGKKEDEQIEEKTVAKGKEEIIDSESIKSTEIGKKEILVHESNELEGLQEATVSKASPKDATKKEISLEDAKPEEGSLVQGKETEKDKLRENIADKDAHDLVKNDEKNNEQGDKQSAQNEPIETQKDFSHTDLIVAEHEKGDSEHVKKDGSSQKAPRASTESETKEDETSSAENIYGKKNIGDFEENVSKKESLENVTPAEKSDKDLATEKDKKKLEDDNEDNNIMKDGIKEGVDKSGTLEVSDDHISGKTDVEHKKVESEKQLQANQTNVLFEGEQHTSVEKEIEPTNKVLGHEESFEQKRLPEPENMTTIDKDGAFKDDTVKVVFKDEKGDSKLVVTVDKENQKQIHEESKDEKESSGSNLNLTKTVGNRHENSKVDHDNIENSDKDTIKGTEDIIDTEEEKEQEASLRELKESHESVRENTKVIEEEHTEEESSLEKDKQQNNAIEVKENVDKTISQNVKSKTSEDEQSLGDTKTSDHDTPPLVNIQKGELSKIKDVKDQVDSVEENQEKEKEIKSRMEEGVKDDPSLIEDNADKKDNNKKELKFSKISDENSKNGDTQIQKEKYTKEEAENGLSKTSEGNLGDSHVDKETNQNKVLQRDSVDKTDEDSKGDEKHTEGYSNKAEAVVVEDKLHEGTKGSKKTGEETDIAEKNIENENTEETLPKTQRTEEKATDKTGERQKDIDTKDKDVGIDVKPNIIESEKYVDIKSSSKLEAVDTTPLKDTLDTEDKSKLQSSDSGDSDDIRNIIDSVITVKEGPVNNAVKAYLSDFIQTEKQNTFVQKSGNVSANMPKDIEEPVKKEEKVGVSAEKKEGLLKGDNLHHPDNQLHEDGVQISDNKSDVMKDVIKSTIFLAETGQVNQIVKDHINTFLKNETENVFIQNDESAGTTSKLVTDHTNNGAKGDELKETQNKEEVVREKSKLEGTSKRDSGKNLKQSEIPKTQQKISHDDNSKQNNKKDGRKIRRVKTVDVINDYSKPKLEIKSRIPTADYRNRVKRDTENGRHSVLIKQVQNSHEPVKKLSKQLSTAIKDDIKSDATVKKTLDNGILEHTIKGNTEDKTDVDVLQQSKLVERVQSVENKPLAHVEETHKPPETKLGNNDDKTESNKSSFDISKLHEELKAVENESKQVKPFSILRQEVKESSLNEDETGDIISNKDQSLKKDAAALKIQSTWRGYAARKIMKPPQLEEVTGTDTKNKEVSSSVPQLGQLSSGKSSHGVVGALELESGVKNEKSSDATSEGEKFVKAATKIQKVWRGFNIRKNIKNKTHQTNVDSQNKIKKKIDSDHPEETVENMDEESNTQQAEMKLNEKFTKAAEKIQKIWRGFRVRKNLKDRKQKLLLEKQQTVVLDDNKESQSASKNGPRDEIKHKEGVNKYGAVNDFLQTDSRFKDAAVTIQRIWRGFNVRRNLKKNYHKEGSVVSESLAATQNYLPHRNKEDTHEMMAHKEEMVDKKVEEIKSVPTNGKQELLDSKYDPKFAKAAVTIQKIWRGFNVRSNLRRKQRNNQEQEAIKTETIPLQKNLGRDDKMQANETQKQKSESSSASEKDNDKFIKAAIKIQTIWRGFNVRKNLAKGDLFGTKIETEKPTEEIIKETEVKGKKSALKIQSLWRGYQVRKNIRMIKNKLEDEITTNDAEKGRDLADVDILNAATKIQAGVRGYLQRKRYKRDINKLNSIIEEDLDEKDDVKHSTLINDVSHSKVEIPLSNKSITHENLKGLEQEHKHKRLSESEVLQALEGLNKLEVPTDTPLRMESNKPTFYRSNTVHEPEIIKKQSFPLLKSISLDNNNNTSDKFKEMAPIEMETQTAIDNITNKTADDDITVGEVKDKLNTIKEATDLNVDFNTDRGYTIENSNLLEGTDTSQKKIDNINVSSQEESINEPSAKLLTANQEIKQLTDVLAATKSTNISQQLSSESQGGDTKMVTDVNASTKNNSSSNIQTAETENKKEKMTVFDRESEAMLHKASINEHEENFKYKERESEKESRAIEGTDTSPDKMSHENIDRDNLQDSKQSLSTLSQIKSISPNASQQSDPENQESDAKVGDNEDTNTNNNCSTNIQNIGSETRTDEKCIHDRPISVDSIESQTTVIHKDLPDEGGKDADCNENKRGKHTSVSETNDALLAKSFDENNLHKDSSLQDDKQSTNISSEPTVKSTNIAQQLDFEGKESDTKGSVNIQNSSSKVQDTESEDNIEEKRIYETQISKESTDSEATVIYNELPDESKKVGSKSEEESSDSENTPVLLNMSSDENLNGDFPDPSSNLHEDKQSIHSLPQTKLIPTSTSEQPDSENQEIDDKSNDTNSLNEQNVTSEKKSEENHMHDGLINTDSTDFEATAIHKEVPDKKDEEIESKNKECSASKNTDTLNVQKNETKNKIDGKHIYDTPTIIGATNSEATEIHKELHDKNEQEIKCDVSKSKEDSSASKTASVLLTTPSVKKADDNYPEINSSLQNEQQSTNASPEKIRSINISQKHDSENQGSNDKLAVDFNISTGNGDSLNNDDSETKHTESTNVEATAIHKEFPDEIEKETKRDENKSEEKNTHILLTKSPDENINNDYIDMENNLQDNKQSISTLSETKLKSTNVSHQSASENQKTDAKEEIHTNISRNDNRSSNVHSDEGESKVEEKRIDDRPISIDSIDSASMEIHKEPSDESEKAKKCDEKKYVEENSTSENINTSQAKPSDENLKGDSSDANIDLRDKKNINQNEYKPKVSPEENLLNETSDKLMVYNKGIEQSVSRSSDTLQSNIISKQLASEDQKTNVQEAIDTDISGNDNNDLHVQNAEDESKTEKKLMHEKLISIDSAQRIELFDNEIPDKLTAMNEEMKQSISPSIDKLQSSNISQQPASETQKTNVKETVGVNVSRNNNSGLNVQNPKAQNKTEKKLMHEKPISVDATESIELSDGEFPDKLTAKNEETKQSISPSIDTLQSSNISQQPASETQKTNVKETVDVNVSRNNNSGLNVQNPEAQKETEKKLMHEKPISVDATESIELSDGEFPDKLTAKNEETKQSISPSIDTLQSSNISQQPASETQKTNVKETVDVNVSRNNNSGLNVQNPEAQKETEKKLMHEKPISVDATESIELSDGEFPDKLMAKNEEMKQSISPSLGTLQSSNISEQPASENQKANVTEAVNIDVSRNNSSCLNVQNPEDENKTEKKLTNEKPDGVNSTDSEATIIHKEPSVESEKDVKYDGKSEEENSMLKNIDTLLTKPSDENLNNIYSDANSALQYANDVHQKEYFPKVSSEKDLLTESSDKLTANNDEMKQSVSPSSETLQCTVVSKQSASEDKKTNVKEVIDTDINVHDNNSGTNEKPISIDSTEPTEFPDKKFPDEEHSKAEGTNPLTAHLSNKEERGIDSKKDEGDIESSTSKDEDISTVREPDLNQKLNESIKKSEVETDTPKIGDSLINESSGVNKHDERAENDTVIENNMPKNENTLAIHHKINETLLEHENLFNDVQSKLLDQISGKNDETLEDVDKKVDIEQLRKNLKDAGIIYDTQENLPHQNSKEELSTHDQLLDYLNNFDSKEERGIESTYLPESNRNLLSRDLPDIKEEELETKSSENDVIDENSKNSLNKNSETNITEEDHEIKKNILENAINIEKIQSTLRECENIAHEINMGIKNIENEQSDHQKTQLNGDHALPQRQITTDDNAKDPQSDKKYISEHAEPTKNLRNDEQAYDKTTGDKLDGKLRDSENMSPDLLVNKNVTEVSSSTSTKRLLHTGELHDTVIIPSIPSSPAQTDSRESHSIENMNTQSSSEDATETSPRSNSKLLHTGELHDTVVVPLPLIVQNNLQTNEKVENTASKSINNVEESATVAKPENITHDFQSSGDSSHVNRGLLHSGELHDTIVVSLSLKDQNSSIDGKQHSKNISLPESIEATVSKKDVTELNQGNIPNTLGQESVPTATSLLHTGELHDTVVVPLSIVNQNGDVNKEDKETGEEQKQKAPGQVDSESQTTDEASTVPIAVQLNQAPAGVEVLTSPRSVTSVPVIIDADSGTAQTPDKGALPIESSSDFSAPSGLQSMESEKRKNAAINNKSMEVEAATKIQAGFRGYQVRKQLKLKNGSSDINNQRRQARRKSSGRITETGRIIQTKPKEQNDIEEKSAVKIQAGVRGFLVRRRQKKQKTQEA